VHFEWGQEAELRRAYTRNLRFGSGESRIHMVNPGGESTMLGHWRIVLRQAEEAVKLGRFEEAYALANRPDVVDHQHAVSFRGRLALELIARATRRGSADDLLGAIEDLDLAERMHAPPDSLAAARLDLAGRVAEEVRSDLDVGEPTRALERIEELARHKIAGPALRRMREIAEAWQTAVAETRRGEFGRALQELDRAERLAAGAGANAMQQSVTLARGEMETLQKSVAPKIEALYAVLTKGEWAQILSAAEAVLASVPEHPAARQARTRAWQQIAAIGPAAARWPQRGGRSGPVEPASGPNPSTGTARDLAGPGSMEAEGIIWLGAANRGGSPVSDFVHWGHVPPVVASRGGFLAYDAPGLARPLERVGAVGPRGRFLLWVDTVGGYLVCLDDEIVLGRAGPDSHCDVPLMGDLSRKHASFIRHGESYLLRAHCASFVNGKSVGDQVVLRDGDVVRLGSTVELEFRQPSPVSATARLVIVSRHRLPLAVDGVLLMADTCIVCDEAQAHIRARAITAPVVLYRQAGALWCRAPGAFEVDGHTYASRAPLTLESSVLGDGFSFSLEPLGSQSV
jgi:FHA domain